jgi:hypothetical protein
MSMDVKPDCSIIWSNLETPQEAAMKKMIPLLVWIMLLAYACAAPVESVTPTSTPAPLTTATATSTPTELPPTPTKEAMISYNADDPANYVEVISGYATLDERNQPVSPVPLDVRVITDDATLDVFSKTTFNELFVNTTRNGENAKDAIVTGWFWAAYRSWQENVQDETVKKERAGISFNEYLQLLSEAHSTGDHTKVLFELDANDMTTLEYDESHMDGIDPFQVTIVNMDSFGVEVQQNMKRIMVANKERAQFGYGVLESTDPQGNSVKEVYIFVHGFNFANGNPAFQ